jgi:hypothetical protein
MIMALVMNSLLSGNTSVSLFCNIAHNWSDFVLSSGIWFVSTAGICVILFMFSGSLTDWFDDSITSTAYLQWHAGIICVRNMAVFIVSVAWPVHLSFAANPFVPLWSNCDALRSLESLLKDIVCIQYFRHFLTRNPSTVQYILCWVEIELYKDMADALGVDSAEAKQHAQRIYGASYHSLFSIYLVNESLVPS